MITVEQAIEMGITKEELEAACVHCMWDADHLEEKVRGVGKWKDYHVFLGEVSNSEIFSSKKSYLELKMRVYQNVIDQM